MHHTAELLIRPATREDLPDIVRMLADDALGAAREAYAVPLPAPYHAAFDAIAADPNIELVVVQAADGRVGGVLQLSFIPNISHQGAWRALIEGVRVDAPLRGAGVGRRLFEWAIERSRARGCKLVQLTSDKSRADAIRFYESLGFKPSHEGLKLAL